jgi:methionine-rich copper-binding protein CopC
MAAAWLLLIDQAGAHAKMIAAQPAADSTVAPPKTIAVHFNEAIEIKLSHLKLSASDGKELAATADKDAADGKTLTIAPVVPLTPGTYTVAWSVVSDDGHRTKGSLHFTVR